MAQLLLAVAVVSALSLLSPRSTASPPPSGKPLVTAVTRDAATKLYTAPLLKADGGGLPLPLVLDLSGPLLWSTCPASHPSYECHHAACARAHAHHPPGCPRTGHGAADDADPFRCRCRAHPYNPFARPRGAAGSGDLTRTLLAANATDGSNPLAPVSFAAVAACAPPTLLAGLPAGAVGVAGLARSWLALPAQVARKQNVARRFALCLPGAGAGAAHGVAIFGGGPLFLLPPGRPDVTANLAGTTPLRGNPRSAGPGYFVSATGIAVNQARVQLQQQGPTMAVALSTRVAYTVLRRDVYAPFLKAFGAATAGMKMKRAAAAAPPFELCYDSRELGSTRLGYAVPQVDLLLESGANWTVFGGNSMVQVSDHTACLAFLEMKEEDEEQHGGSAPAVVIGGFQMENNLLVFDDDKGQLGFSGLLFGRQTTCSNFNFTLAA